jgi:hypothetical protein
MVFGARTTRSDRFVLAALTLLLLCGVAMAQQETGQVSGTIKDQSGAVIVGAAVVVKNAGTGAERAMTTTQAGVYSITNLPPGTYAVMASMKGFSTAKKQIELYVGAKAGVDFTLEVGSSTTVIEVAGAAEQVNVESQVLMDVVNTKQIEELPTLTRNPYDLVALGGNIARDTESDRGTGFAINGQRSSSTSILLDGGENTDTFVAGIGQSVPLDSVQEFSVVSSSFTAEFGRAGGGVVNVATKSGSNGFHGSLYEFNRVSALSSNTAENNATGTKKGVFARNQFGYSIGGPVIKDKLFFFNNTEWFRVRSTSTSIAMVPTDQLIAASNQATKNFFAAYGALKSNVVVQESYTKAGIPGLCSSGGLCDALPASTPVWKKVAYPVLADSGGGDPRNEYQTVVRVDYNMSPNTTIYGRYALQNVNAFEGTNGDSPYVGFDAAYSNFNQSWLASVTHTFTPKLVSQTKAVFSRQTNDQPLGKQPLGASLFLSSNSVTSTLLGTQVALPGYLPYSPAQGIPAGGPQNLGQLMEDVSWVHGNHTFRFGGSYIYLRDNRMFGAYTYAIEQLGNSLSSGMENFLRGQLRTFTGAVDPQGKYPGDSLRLPVGSPDSTRSNRYHDFAFYGQDAWKVSPRITLNLGLRWEYYGVQHNKNPKKDSNFFLGTGSTMEDQIASGMVKIAPNSPYNGLWDKDLNNFAPRVGLAWDLFGNGKTSLRGGYGLSYERNFGNVTFNVIQNPPNYATVAITPADLGGNLPIYTNQSGPLGGTSGTKALLPSTLRAVNEHMKNAYAHIWSVSVEHELAPNTILSLEYSGSKGEGLYGINRENLPGSYQVYRKTFNARPAVAGWPDGNGFDGVNGQYSVINYRTTGGFSNYNAMVASLTSRGLFQNSLQFTFNYTLSHSIDNLSSTFSDSANDFNLGFIDPRNPMLDKGDAEFDHRHRASISAIWSVPFAKNLNKASRMIFDGWQFTPMISMQTGSPFTIFDCTNGYYACNRMIMVASGTPLRGTGTLQPTGEPNRFEYIDLSAQLAKPANGAFGNVDYAYINDYSGTADFGPYPANMSRRSLFRRPGTYDVTLGIMKDFYVSEGKKIQFRAEFYNLLNHSNLYIDGSTADISSQTYITALRGQNPSLTNEYDRRNIQFALKFTF